MKETILTGIRCNDEPTLGNYIGAMLPMVELQAQYAGAYRINMFVPDLHSFTTPIDHTQLYDNVIKGLSYFIASGLDIAESNTYIYRQSYIPAHSEMTWILDCFAYFGEMSRMTQFKEKSDGQSNVSVGLFNYPVLMAADILLYGAKWVPVGDDQTQHIEITRDIAQRMNHKFHDVYPDNLFVVPEATERQVAFAKRDKGIRIRSLANPEKKMSKSIKDPRGTILLSDEPAVAAKKVMSATTDSFGSVKFDWENQPGVTNLLQILAHMTKRPQAEVNAEWEGNERYGDLKKAVATEVERFLTAFQAAYHAIDQDELMNKLEADERAMTEVANHTLLRTQRAVGLRPRE